MTKEVVWLHRLSADFSAKRRLNHPTPTIYFDSQRAIHLIRNPVYHMKTKHIEVRFHDIRELVTKKKLEVWKIDIEVNIVDSLTKPLSDQRFKALRGHTGLQQASKQRGAERGAEGKLKNDMNKQVERQSQRSWTAKRLKMQPSARRTKVHETIEG